MTRLWFAGPSIAHIPDDSPLPVVLLKEKLAIFKNSTGVHCLADSCPHRQASLSLGKVRDDCLTCPYHGWRFNGVGRVQEIPAHPKQKIPNNFVAPGRELVEFGGWTFLQATVQTDATGRIVLQDTSELDDCTPVKFEDLDQKFFALPDGNCRAIHGTYDWVSNFSRVVANGIDFAHLPFLHADSFGNAEKEEVENYRCSDFAGGSSSSLMLVPPDNFQQKLFRFFVKGGRKNQVKGKVSFLVPNMARLDLELGFGAKMTLLAAHLPLSATRTRTYWVLQRNFATTPLFDSMFHLETLKIFEADRAVVESQSGAMPLIGGQDLTVASDSLEIRYRKMMYKLCSKL